MSEAGTIRGLAKPAWYAEQIRDGAAHAPMPPSRDEQWRFSKRKGADFTSFSPALPVEGACPASRMLEGSVKAEVLNGVWQGVEGALPEGLEILTLGQWIATNESEAREWLGRALPDLGSAAFAAWHRAMMTEAVVVKAHPGCRIETPVEVLWRVEGDDAAVFPWTLVCAGEGSELSVLERHVGAAQGVQLAVGIQWLNAGLSSTLHYALLQQMNGQSSSLELGAADVGEEAKLEHLSIHAGSIWARQELACRMTGRGSKADLLSAASLSGEQVLDQRTYQAHLVPDAASNLVYRNVLRDATRSVFGGMIRVDEGAHGSDAYQSNKNMLLSGKAEADSMPGLEILADGVRCSHGSATSSLSPDEVFYLCSRGIPERVAQSMIASGFLRQAVSSFGDEAIASCALQALEGNP